MQDEGDCETGQHKQFEGGAGIESWEQSRSAEHKSDPERPHYQSKKAVLS
jgi:hypothetical protein